MSDEIRHFLLIYDARTRRVEIEDFGTDAQAAAARYSAAEEELGRREGFEIVLIGADSVATIKTTHAHYFDDDSDGVSLRSRVLAGLSD